MQQEQQPPIPDMPNELTEENIHQWFRSAARAAHPDHGGTDDLWHATVRMRDAALQRVRSLTVVDHSERALAEFRMQEHRAKQAAEQFGEKRKMVGFLASSPKQRLRKLALIATALTAVLAAIVPTNWSPVRPLIRAVWPLQGEDAMRRMEEIDLQISELENIKKDLRDSQMTLRKIIESMPEGKFLGDQTGYSRSEFYHELRNVEKERLNLQKMSGKQDSIREFVGIVVVKPHPRLSGQNISEAIKSWCELKKCSFVEIFAHVYRENWLGNDIANMVVHRRQAGLPGESDNFVDFFVPMPDVNSYLETAKVISERLRSQRRIMERSVKDYEKEIDSIQNYISMAFVVLAGLLGISGTILTYRLSVIDSNIKWIDENMNSKTKLGLLLQELFDPVPDVFDVTELTGKLLDLSHRPREVAPKYLSQDDIWIIGRLIRHTIRPIDLAELVTAKGVQLAMVESTGGELGETFRLRRA